MLVRATLLCSLLLLAACAAALPGYTPPPFKESKAVQPMKSGDMDNDGVYHMSGQEKGTDCRHLRGSMMVTISRLRHRDGEAPPSALAAGANKATAPIFSRSSSKGLDRDAEYARDRARLEAYNQQLAAKGCETVNIEAELARPPDAAGK
jgi:hypothetical protein